ncbi:Fic family protein [Nocardioides aquiterrae]|uniref:Fic family protein n=1 Tax=Nocardioides aquiterrae TaxID=203799 RepID=UPI0031DA60EA
MQSNLDKVAQDVVLDAFSGDPITAELIKAWHRRMYDCIPVPCDAYLGNFRGDSTHSELLDAENHVGGIRGVRSYLVFGQVEALLARVRDDIEELGTYDLPPLARDMAVLRIASYAHGEWVRIHPFVNGNGRTARLIVLWILARHGIAPLLPIRPSPAPPYGSTARASMAGEHEPFEQYLRDQYVAKSQNAETSSDTESDQPSAPS